MPFNVTQGSTVEFTVEFFNANGVLTVPSSATLTVTYTTTSGGSSSTTVALTQSNSFFTGTWGSGVAALGLATVSITAPGQATPTTATLRILSE